MAVYKRKFLQRDYRTHFSSKQYLQTYYRNSSLEGDWTRFCLRLRHEFFARYSSKWDKDRAKYLEFGGGPVVVDLISAEPHVAEIVHAAHTEDERKEIGQWMNKHEDAHDWAFVFKHVVGELESKEGDEAWKDREAALRSKIKIIGCDIKQEHPIGPTEEPSPFTIISTSLCLEAACETFTEYKMAIKRLGKLLKLGGYLIMTVVEDQTFYTIGQHKWSTLPVTMEQVKEALVEAGFVVLMAEREPTSVETIQNPTISDEKALLFLAAHKVKDNN